MNKDTQGSLRVSQLGNHLFTVWYSETKSYWSLQTWHTKLTASLHLRGRQHTSVLQACAEKLCQTAMKKVNTIICAQLKAEMSKQHPQCKKKNIFPFKYAIDNFSVFTILNCMVLTEHQCARSVLVFYGFKKYIYGKWCYLSLLLLYRKIKENSSSFLHNFIYIEFCLFGRIRSFGKWVIYHAPSFLPQEGRAIGFVSNCTVHHF